MPGYRVEAVERLNDAVPSCVATIRTLCDRLETCETKAMMKECLDMLRTQERVLRSFYDAAEPYLT
jgi:hypothetical protein